MISGIALEAEFRDSEREDLQDRTESEAGPLGDTAAYLCYPTSSFFAKLSWAVKVLD